ncbi:MAG: tyrosine-type recombinase/integrase, partial [Vicinamibacterales bacterium]
MLRVHLAKAFGDKRLDEISTEDVQRLKAALVERAPKNEASFHDFDEIERLVEVARSEALALLVVVLGGEAGLRCGEIMALEWTDVDFAKRQLTVARSEWKGHVT